MEPIIDGVELEIFLWRFNRIKKTLYIVRNNKWMNNELSIN
jgi:hypothetical protein